MTQVRTPVELFNFYAEAMRTPQLVFGWLFWAFLAIAGLHPSFREELGKRPSKQQSTLAPSSCPQITYTYQELKEVLGLLKTLLFLCLPLC